MPSKASSAGDLDSFSVSLPLNAFFELREFQDQLLSAARTLDPATSPCPATRPHEQSRHRALASVFRTWADQVDRSLELVRPT